MRLKIDDVSGHEHQTIYDDVATDKYYGEILKLVSGYKGEHGVIFRTGNKKLRIEVELTHEETIQTYLDLVGWMHHIIKDMRVK